MAPRFLREMLEAFHDARQNMMWMNRIVQSREGCAIQMDTFAEMLRVTTREDVYKRQIYFPEHVQVLYGENEYGKSTIYAFIKAMLFGMERGRGRAAGRDDFSRYEPWENPNYYAGMMRFRCGTRIFRLERSFDRYTKRVSLICENDGEELSVENLSLIHI